MGARQHPLQRGAPHIQVGLDIGADVRVVADHAAAVLALDQGTSSSRAIVFHRDGYIVAMAQRKFRQIFPQPGWVEHDPMEIWSSQSSTAAEAIAVGKRLNVARLNLHGTGLGDMGVPIPRIGSHAPGAEQRARDTLHRIAHALGVTVPSLFLPPEFAVLADLSDDQVQRVVEYAHMLRDAETYRRR